MSQKCIVGFPELHFIFLRNTLSISHKYIVPNLYWSQSGVIILREVFLESRSGLDLGDFRVNVVSQKDKLVSGSNKCTDFKIGPKIKFQQIHPYIGSS